MTEPQLSKVELTEIADFRGNLSFAEEGHPIPFSIQSVFWTTLKQDYSLHTEAATFFIVLDGEVQLKHHTLERPNQACYAEKGSRLELRLMSESAILLMLMDRKIRAKDTCSQRTDRLVDLPQTEYYPGLKGYFANANSTLPCGIKRVYFTYQIPHFAKRGGHAHIYTKELVLPLKGGVEVLVDNNKSKSTYPLSVGQQGLFLDTGLWRELENFKDNSLLLVIASEKYFEPDYIRNYRDFKLKY